MTGPVDPAGDDPFAQRALGRGLQRLGAERPIKQTIEVTGAEIGKLQK